MTRSQIPGLSGFRLHFTSVGSLPATVKMALAVQLLLVWNSVWPWSADITSAPFYIVFQSPLPAWFILWKLRLYHTEKDLNQLSWSNVGQSHARNSVWYSWALLLLGSTESYMRWTPAQEKTIEPWKAQAVSLQYNGVLQCPFTQRLHSTTMIWLTAPVLPLCLLSTMALIWPVSNFFPQG